MALDLKKSESLRTALDAIEVNPERVFNESFLDKFTPFDDYKELLSSLSGRNVNGTVPAGITIGEVNEAVKRKTGFDSWPQMLDKALREFWKDPRKNRRSDTRFRCDVNVVIQTGLEKLNGTMLNVSTSGLKVRTTDDVPNVRFLNVSIPLDEFKDQSGTMQVRATIQWREDDDSGTTLGLEILSKQTLSA